MKFEAPKAIHLKDYTPPPFWAKQVHLTFDIHADRTLVISKTTYERSDKDPQKTVDLSLHGNDLDLKGIRLNDSPLPQTAYLATPDQLIVRNVPNFFELELVTELKPQDNKSLEGLYQSGPLLCTQCEPEGFRRITYFLDRPDVMATYTTRIIANKKDFPVLLSNGNPMEAGDLPAGRHYMVWHDPYPKPCYLFALVAGDLAHQESRFATQSGREVTLRIYVEKPDINKCDFAMQALKLAMKWDEDTYGLEYDLDIFMIVAVSSFNAGAMENKGLNIFNSKYVLANPETATDNDFLNILGVIGHEYFHNWSGNRVTCRDWFQLSLKEGFTVFRDQEFSADMSNPAVARIRQAVNIKSGQFAEDRSPMAHPVRPDSYVEINNFYTQTVYSKGAEVIRMMHTIIGAEGFHKGAALYFQRHDGQAVTIEDFVKAMEDANSVSLSQFMQWYHQAGTPTLTCSSRYDSAQKQLTLNFKQTLPPTPGQMHKKNHVIPVRMGLIDRQGQAIPLIRQGQSGPAKAEEVLLVTEAEQTFVFANVAQAPILSLLRGFSAPVYLETTVTREDRIFLMSHDPDEYNRFEAGQQLAVEEVMRMGTSALQNVTPKADTSYLQAFGTQLRDHALDPAFMAEAIALPDADYLANLTATVNIEQIDTGLRSLTRLLGEAHWDSLWDLYQRHHHPTAPAGAPTAVGPRKLKNKCLQYLTATGRSEAWDLAYRQFEDAHNMTDSVMALFCITNDTSPRREKVFQRFYDRWHHEKLVLDKWFSMQAATERHDAIATIEGLLRHKDYDRYYPNRVYSVFGPFMRLDPVGMHHPSGRGYEILMDEILAIDAYNGQVASRLAQKLANFKQLDANRQKLVRQCLEKILAKPGLSRDVLEVVSKGLA